IPGALSKARKGDNSCLALEGVCCRGTAANNPAQGLLKGGVKNFRELDGGINNGWNVPPGDDRYVVIQVLLPIISLDKQLFNSPKDQGHLDTSATNESKGTREWY
ncbi:hypothetical protein DV515_00006044, partial [Chloebia gouldiae]